jgi:hypothetical protein
MAMIKLSCAQVDRERVGLLHPDAVVNALGYHLDHNVDLMRRTPDGQHVIFAQLTRRVMTPA